MSDDSNNDVVGHYQNQSAQIAANQLAPRTVPQKPKFKFGQQVVINNFNPFYDSVRVALTGVTAYEGEYHYDTSIGLTIPEKCLTEANNA
jgi:hypothetical protein